MEAECKRVTLDALTLERIWQSIRVLRSSPNESWQARRELPADQAIQVQPSAPLSPKILITKLVTKSFARWGRLGRIPTSD